MAPVTSAACSAQSWYEGKTVLVAGAGGYIGTGLSHALAGRCRLLLLRRGQGPVMISNDRSQIFGDVSSPEAWRQVIGSGPLDVVFHLAAYEPRRGLPRDPLQDASVNALSMLHLLEACRAAGQRPTIVFASSINVVGDPIRLPVDDQTADAPLTLYAIHKLAGEGYLRHYGREHGIPGVSLRLSNVYGPLANRDVALSSRVVVNQILLRGLRGEALTLFANRGCRRDFLYIDDALRAFLLAPQLPPSAGGLPLRVVSGDGMSIAAMVEAVADRVAAATGRRPSIVLDEETRLEPVEWRNLTTSPSASWKSVGWSPEVPLRVGLDSAIEAFRAAREAD